LSGCALGRAQTEPDTRLVARQPVPRPQP
jgi:hypothetical protein